MSVFVKNIAATVLQRNLFCKSMYVIISPGIVSGDVTSNSFFVYLSRMNLVTDSFISTNQYVRGNLITIGLRSV